MALGEYTKFKELLRKAIGGSMQAEFAKKSGISAEHLNRMLNARQISRPTMLTLSKIAENASGGVTLQDLIDALDFNNNPKLEDMSDKSFTELAESAFASFSQALRDVLGGWPFRAEDLNTFMEEAVKRYNYIRTCNIDMSYDIDLKGGIYLGNLYKDAEHYAFVNLNISGGYQGAYSKAVLYFSAMPKTGECLILHANMDLRHIIELDGYPPALMHKYNKMGMNDEAAMEEIRNLDYCIEYKPVRAWDLNAGKRLLDIIFNNEKKPEEYEYDNISGFGFYLNNIPKNLKNFIAAHAGSIFCGSRNIGKKAEIEALANNPEKSSDDIAKALEKYFDDYICEGGWRAAICAAMRKETGFGFMLHTKPEDEKILKKLPELSDGAAVIITDAYLNYRHISHETVAAVTNRYAYELGLEEFGDMKYMSWGLKEPAISPRIYKPSAGLPEESGAQPAWADAAIARPEKAGMYDVLLKDGRKMKMLYSDGTWLYHYKNWADMVEAYAETE